MKILDNVPDNKAFVLSDGSHLSNLQKLYDSLKFMSDDVFVHHVNKQKNDFANWVNDVFLDKKFAKQLSASKSKYQVLQLVGKRIALAKKPKIIVKSKKIVKQKKVIKKPVSKVANKKIVSKEKIVVKQSSVKTKKAVIKKKPKKQIKRSVKMDKNLLQVLSDDAKRFFSRDTLSIVKNDFKSLFKQ